MLAKALSAATAAAAEKLYIEEVFSTWLYTGNNGTQTITNGIDLSGKGGLVWIKSRSGIQKHRLTDTARGATKSLDTNTSTGQVTESTGVTSFSSSGFAIGNDSDYNTFDANYASWTFRKAAKFFDVVTYTGNGSSTQTISHALGSVPGSIIAKGTSALTDWPVYHRSLNGGTTPEQWYVSLNATSAQSNAVANWGNVAPTSTTFTVGGNNNVNGISYVAYLFAHDAGGFGDSGNDSVVSCGSFTESGSGVSVNLGWEPQWLLVKKSDAAASWVIFDNMRGTPVDNYWSALFPNSSGAESGSYLIGSPTATGFKFAASGAGGWSNGTYIYIAIRRGPMKTPTDATKVFSAQAVNGSTAFTTNFPVDLAMFGIKVGSLDGFMTFDRQRGSLAYLKTTSTAAEATTTSTYETVFDNNTGSNYKWWSNTSALAGWNFRRAPGFFDVVAYAGGGFINESISHNLGVKPELVIIKRRNASELWWVNAVFGASTFQQGSLNTTDQFTATTYSAQGFGNPTSSALVFNSIGSSGHASGGTYIAYLFATCSGISKVGSYTGTGTTQQINCGFTAGARFVLIKRTDSTGDWYVWDTARGIISGNDPYLLLNSTAAEVTNTDYIDPLNSGFEISSTAPAAINANGGSFIFLAVA